MYPFAEYASATRHQLGQKWACIAQNPGPNKKLHLDADTCNTRNIYPQYLYMVCQERGQQVERQRQKRHGCGKWA